MKKAKLILVAGRQAVLLPDEFRFEGSEVTVCHDPANGDVILSGKPRSWEDFFETVRQTEIPAGFMEDREQGTATRDPFEGWIESGETRATDDLPIAREAQTVAFYHANVIIALEDFTRTSEFDHLRQDVIEGRMSFDDAVKKIISSLALNPGLTDRAHGR